MMNFRTYKLAVEFYRRTQNLCLARHLKDQLNRAAASVALNLAEGHGRKSMADRKRFFQMAMGSLRECQAILELGASGSKLVAEADCLAAHLYKLLMYRG
jgi:four helix bundle protein